MRVVHTLFVVLFVAAYAPEGYAEEWPDEIDLTQAEIREMNAFATDVLEALQEISFAEEREFCGYILMDEDGLFSATDARRGDFDSCDSGPLSADVVASYHTHGAFDPDYNSEWPSTDDLLADFEIGIDGYVATPGGRVWRVSHDEERAILLCDAGCVIADPDDDPSLATGIPATLTLEEIERLE